MATTLCILLAITLVWLFIDFRRQRKAWDDEKDLIRRAGGLPGGNTKELCSHLLELRENHDEVVWERYLRRLFESLLNEIRQGVIIVNQELEIKFANRTAAELFSRESLQRGRTLMEELREHRVSEAVRTAIADHGRTEREFELLPASDAETLVARHFLIEAAPLAGDGEMGAWVMIHDITEARMTEQIRKDFVANASHELRTPLTLINGYIETLRSGVITDRGGLERCLEVMEKHGNRIERLVEDMLTISKLENHDALLTVEPFSVRACVEDVLERLRSLMPDREYNVELHFPKNGGILHGDRFYWDQVFVNLIENAIKENPANDNLLVRVSGEWFEKHCILEVSDNGSGIPAHDLPFVFKRFYRGHKSHSQTIRGTGLGLSIVRRAVEAHNGNVKLTSTPGKHTTFTMEVPLGAASAKGKLNTEKSLAEDLQSSAGVKVG